MKQSDTKNGEKLMGRIDLKGKTVLITGAAGFIGAALAERMPQTMQLPFPASS